ncbi:MAG: hypothetical protein HC846_08180 [Blastocatellia bacterium]|nr:hypothetical protein [Blastocatellia bacterium]
MKYKLALSLLVLMLFGSANFAQTELTIKKKTSMKIPGMESMQMPAGTKSPFEPRTSTVYIKGARMRSDMQMQVPKMSGFGGGMKTSLLPILRNAISSAPFLSTAIRKSIIKILSADRPRRMSKS